LELAVSSGRQRHAGTGPHARVILKPRSAAWRRCYYQPMKQNLTQTAPALVLACLVLTACTQDASHEISQAEVDKANFGKPENILFWEFEQKVAGFRNIDKFGEIRSVAAGNNPYPLPSAAAELHDIAFEYQGETWTVDRYIEQHKVAGLLVVKDGSVVLERYALGNTRDSRWISFSVAKSVTSMLVGAALQDGYIASVDDRITDYLPRLKNSSYDQSSIRNVLQMSSGVEWNEDYADPESDINQVPWSTLQMVEYLRNKPRSFEPGEKFNYNTAETNLVGDFLRSAIGNNLSTYLSQKIWQPFGMERDAYWVLTDDGGGEFGGSSLNATLRDFARIGLFALNDGVLPDGTRVLPEGWMQESITPSQGHDGYGYLWWLRGRGEFAASGIFGQAIHIDPAHRIVIAQHSARDAASDADDRALQLAMFRALVDAASQ
jgi:CubicO group peptidase (beta-lactamase class C family)